jgi:hypothetical protein
MPRKNLLNIKTKETTLKAIIKNIAFTVLQCTSHSAVHTDFVTETLTIEL